MQVKKEFLGRKKYAYFVQDDFNLFGLTVNTNAASTSIVTGYIQMELLTCCFGRKHKNLVLFWKIFSSYMYIYVLLGNDTVNDSGRYFTCGVCNFKNIVKNCKKASLGHEILVISLCQFCFCEKLD